jgi:DNA repair protein RadD
VFIVSYSQKLLNSLVSIPAYKLKEIAGNRLIETAKTLDENADSLRNIIELIQDLHEPQKLLINRQYRQYLIESLSIEDAENLARRFNYAEGINPYVYLVGLNNAKGVRQIFFDYFDIRELEAQEEISEFYSLTTVTPKYALYDYQNKAVEESLEILSRANNNNLLIHMPTGSGKTRTAMHLISRVLNHRPGKVVVWLAHSEELCEQAAEEFEKSWKNLGNRDIKLGRYFDRGNIELQNFDEGIIIAGLNKLYKRSLSEQSAFLQFQRNVTLVVFDEAHQATADTYNHLVNLLTIGGSVINFIGLTATPGRSTLAPEQTEELANLFNRNKVTLKIKNFANPIDYLISKGYLAKPVYEYFNFKSEEMYVTNALAKRLEQGKDFDKKTLLALGVDINRNLIIFEMIRDLIKRHSKIIVFCASVEHTHLIASILKIRGYDAKAVTGDSSSEYRRNTIASFKNNDEGSLNIIVNYGILTTGFDAPKASAAIIARPTQSVMLYSQMVGRVLRGPLSKGTDTCEVFTIVDEIQGFRSIYEGFSYWDEFWD